jgi:hypothetical protein
MQGRRKKGGTVVKQWIVNAAFNSGNSGGPLIHIETGHVIGVVSSKLAPLSESSQSILTILEKQKYGMQYGLSRPDGTEGRISEAQLVGMVLKELRQQVQLVIGMAATAEGLWDFLTKNGVTP